MPTTQELMDVIIGPQASIGTSWFDRTQVSMARMLGEKCPVSPPTDPDALNSFLLHLHYYDLAQSEYIVHKRTGDAQFLAYARKCADSWWKYPAIDEGRMRSFEQAATSPKFAGVAGLILRALDGRPELWDWIVQYTRHARDIWLKPRINYPTLHYGVREGAFTLRFMALLSQVLPDSFPLQAGGMATNGSQIRAEMLADTEAIAVSYYGRLQFPDGSWRWNDPDETDADGGTLQGITQPFQIGLLLRALVDVYNATSSATVRLSIQDQILKSCRHLYGARDTTGKWVGPYRKEDPIPFDPSRRRRGMWYLYHGGTSVNPTKFANGGWAWPGTTVDQIQDERQALATVIAAYGWAWDKTRDPFFLEAGNELWDSAYGGTDGIRNYINTDGKGFNQNSWSSSYPVWAGGVIEPPLPAPLPVEPLPPKPIEPAPAPLPGTPVTVSVLTPTSGATLSGRVKVTAQASDESMITGAYLLVDGFVRGAAPVAPYAFDWDTTMLPDGEYSLFVRAWDKSNSAIDSPVVKVVVANKAPEPEPAPIPPEPIPVPAPEPPKPCSISAPASVSIPRNSTGSIGVILQDLTGPVEVKVIGSDGQVTVSPLSWTATATSSSKQFQVRVKKQSRTIRFESPCGVAVVRVNVT